MLASLAHPGCSFGETNCPVTAIFTRTIVQRIGPPDGGFAWACRAALAAGALIRELPDYQRIHLTWQYSRELVAWWKQDDREGRVYERKLEDEAFHATPDEVGVWGRRFDPVERMLFGQAQPPFYLEAFTVSGLTFKRGAKVRVPSTYVHLFVDVGDAPAKRGRNARRKLARYGKPPRVTVAELCEEAVKDYWAKAP